MSARRRSLLGGLAGLLAAPAMLMAATAAPVAGPPGDAALLDLVREFWLVDARVQETGGLHVTVHVSDDEFNQINDHWWQIVRTIEGIPATTAAGIAAKASVLPALIRGLGDGSEPKCTFALSLVDDILREESA